MIWSHQLFSRWSYRPCLNICLIWSHQPFRRRRPHRRPQRRLYNRLCLQPPSPTRSPLISHLDTRGPGRLHAIDPHGPGPAGHTSRCGWAYGWAGPGCTHPMDGPGTGPAARTQRHGRMQGRQDAGTHGGDGDADGGGERPDEGTHGGSVQGRQAHGAAPCGASSKAAWSSGGGAADALLAAARGGGGCTCHVPAAAHAFFFYSAQADCCSAAISQAEHCIG
jgi:hypothetical protein